MRRTGMQIPDQPVKRERTNCASMAALGKSLQGALQLMLRALGWAGIKFAPHFTERSFGRDSEAAERRNEQARTMSMPANVSYHYDYLTASARQFLLGET